ncbi:MAG: isoprenylcysteine carboxylmethyltransferase family protein [Erysipelotrichaceae bacterium]|nr:isoprenylcysteine carboxylmethyltransferase family protein [Erysipelotrichaceae bacterium]
MNKELFKKALIRFSCGLIIVGAILFISAGTLSYPQGWLFMSVLFIPMFIAGLVMLKKDPELLRRRLEAKEEESVQQKIILLSAIMFLAAFIAAGISFRFDLFMIPLSGSIIASVVFLASYGLYAEVMRENSYLSRTIKVEEDQEVVDTGLYGIVRHPMYMATLILFEAMPLVLGSLLSLVIMLTYIPLIISRIRNEEEVLERELKGYTEYKKKVKYRLIPFLW